MARILFFRMVLRKLSEITTNKPVSTIFFTIMNISFFSLPFDLLSIIARKSGAMQSVFVFLFLLCTHFGSLQCFSTYFRKLKKVGVLRPIFPEMLFLVTMIKIRNESLMNINFSIVNQCNCYQICQRNSIWQRYAIYGY